MADLFRLSQRQVQAEDAAARLYHAVHLDCLADTRCYRGYFIRDRGCFGSEETELGRVRVDQAQEKFSIASNIDCDLESIKRGDMALSLKPAESHRFSEPWPSVSAKKKGFGRN